MKSILHLTETSEPGGSETVLAHIAKNLDPNRYRSLVCLLNKGWLSDHLRKIGVDYVVIENKRPFDPVFLTELVSLIKHKKINLIHAHEFAMNVYGSVASRIALVPMIGTIHGKGYFTDKQRRAFVYKLALGLCSQVVAVSEDLKRYITIVLKINPKRILTIYNGINLNEYPITNSPMEIRNQLSIPPGTVVAGTVGSLFEVKGLPYLLEAAKKIITCFPDFKLLIAGEGNQEAALNEEIIALKLQETVKFLGFRDDVPKLLNLFDIYVCSSISEGLSLSILEAMAAGKPVVATAVGGNPELIIHGQNGFLVPSKDPEALAQKVLVLLKDKNLRESMGKKGRVIVEKKFSLKKMIENYQNLYEKLLS
jgi:glycosyltransferase involved in cell wall biosynthesis